jgi:bifunctional DNA-binding transcriptional regulator/antitoxin component of YhaV-PrlF toxin-antitoxin module
MIRKNNTHESVVYNYFFATGSDRHHFNKGSRIFFEGDILYSYGYHFPLAVKSKNGYVLNGDKYSVTTSKHQSITRQMAEEHSDETTSKKHTVGNCRPVHHCIIPFSSLDAAGIKPRDVVILDVTRDTYETVKRRNPKTMKMEEYQIHHLGATLIKINRKRFQSSIDSSSKNHSFYLVEIQSKNVNTVKDAFRDLAGNLSDEQYQEYQHGGIKRQGEYFLEPKPEMKTRELKKKARRLPVPIDGILDVKVKTPSAKQIVKRCLQRENMGYGGITREQIRVIRYEGARYYVLIDRDHIDMKIPRDAVIHNQRLVVYRSMVHQYDLSQGNGNPHVARDMIQTLDKVFIRKTLRHRDHRMQCLHNIWHQVYRNTAVNSWTANGSVD